MKAQKNVLLSDRVTLRSPALRKTVGPLLNAGVLHPQSVFLVDTLARLFNVDDAPTLLAAAAVVEAESRGHAALNLACPEAQLAAADGATDGETGAVEPVAAVEDAHTNPSAETRTRGGSDEGDEGVSEDDEALETGADVDVAAQRNVTPSERARELLAAAGLARSPGPPLFGPPEPPEGENPPLVYDASSGLACTRRFYDEQQRIASSILRRAEAGVLDAGEAERLANGFLPEASPEVRGAVAGALASGLTIITGGPGTGKTFTVLRLLGALLSAPGGETLRIALCAPTGKAAVRMREALTEGKNGELLESEKWNAIAPRIRALVPRTVQKLLRQRPDGSVGHGPDDRLPYDLVVVDEASMLDLVLLRRLLEALPDAARLVLLGDRDQLASVEAGSALGDLVEGKLQQGIRPLDRRVVFFGKSHRFSAAPWIGAFAGLVQRRPGLSAEAHRADLDLAVDLLVGADDLSARLRTRAESLRGMASVDLAEALTTCADERGPPPDGEAAPRTLTRKDLPKAGREGRASREALIKGLAEQYWDTYFDRLRAPNSNPTDALKALDGFRVLCTHRAGPLGVSGINRALAAELRRRAQASAQAGTTTRALRARQGVWEGLPVLITENAWDLGLANGDVGLVVRGPEHGGLVVIFPATGEGDGPTELRRVAPARLPPWQPAFAMTIHKSQGSQYENVAVVLAGRPSPIETRELIYTGVTRAKKGATVYGTEEDIRRALHRPVARLGFLRGLLGVPAPIEAPPPPPAANARPALAAPAVVAAPTVVATPAPAPDAPPLARAVAVVLAATAPLARADITKAADIDDTTWAAIRASLEASPDVVRMGTKRGTRYASNRVYDELIVEAIWTTDIDGGDGALTGHVTATFEQKWGPAEDNAWSAAIARLLKSGRVTKTGKKRGTRYRVG
jgi:exodeoxyribonuclease V alpha subunit